MTCYVTQDKKEWKKPFDNISGGQRLGIKLETSLGHVTFVKEQKENL